MTRRRFLGAGTVGLAALASGVVQTRWPLRASAHDGLADAIWAATKPADRYVLLGDGTKPAVLAAVVGDDRTLTVTERLADLPEGFSAWVVLAHDDAVLIGGSETVVTGEIVIDNRRESYPPGEEDAIPTGLPQTLTVEPVLDAVPRLFSLRDGVLEKVPIPEIPGGHWGGVGAMASLGARHVALAVVGSTSVESAYASTLHILESVDAATSWTFAVTASDLGEGGFPHLVWGEGGLATLIVDGAGNRHLLHRPSVDAPWSTTIEGRGEIVATIPMVDGTAVVVVSGGDEVPTAVVWRRGEPIGPGTPVAAWSERGTPHAVLPVVGAAGEAVIVTESGHWVWTGEDL